jgi:hypothetical protein
MERESPFDKLFNHINILSMTTGAAVRLKLVAVETKNWHHTRPLRREQLILLQFGKMETRVTGGHRCRIGWNFCLRGAAASARPWARLPRATAGVARRHMIGHEQSGNGHEPEYGRFV